MYLSMMFLPTQAPSLRLYTPNQKKEEERNHIKTRQRNLEHWLIVHCQNASIFSPQLLYCCTTRL